jgi:ABC-type Fe3+ transport system substrate-binding protein
MIMRGLRLFASTLVATIVILLLAASPAVAQEVTVLCNFEVDWCEALKAAYEKSTGQKAVFIRRTDGESLAQIRAEKANPRADVYHAAESASAKVLAAEGLLEAYQSPMVAQLHDWARAIAVNKFQIPSNRMSSVHPMAPKPSEVKLIKLDLDKYGSKEGRERLLSRWENEVFKAPK